MNDSRQLTIENLRAVAELNGMCIDDTRLVRLLPLVQALWDGVAALDELDLDGVEPELLFRAGWEEDDASGR